MNLSQPPSDSSYSQNNIPTPSINPNPLDMATQIESTSAEHSSLLTRPHNRKPNWRHNEDVALCQAWVRCSENPIITGNRLWNRIFEDFCEQLPGTKRTKKSLENRWSSIQDDVTKWKVIMNRVYSTNLADEWGVCYKAFRDDHGRDFKFYHCWKILHSSVKSQGSTDPTQQPICSTPSDTLYSSNRNPPNMATEFKLVSIEHSIVPIRTANRSAPNWKHNEDIALCQAWVRCSENPIITGDSLWNRIYEDFSEKLHGTKRTKKSLENRWTSIQGDVNKWKVIVNRVDRSRSDGTNPDDERGVCYKAFMDDHGHTFKFYHCWEILHCSVKWNDASRRTYSRSDTVNAPPPVASPMHDVLVIGLNGMGVDSLHEPYVGNDPTSSLLPTGPTLSRKSQDMSYSRCGPVNTLPSLASPMHDASGTGLDGIDVDSLHDSSSIPSIDNDPTSTLLPTEPTLNGISQGGSYSRGDPINTPPLLASPMHDASSIRLDGIGVNRLHDSSSIPSIDNDPTSSLLLTGPTLSGKGKGRPYSISDQVNTPPLLASPMHDAFGISLDGIGVNTLHDSSSIPSIDNDPTSTLLPTGPTLNGNSQDRSYSRINLVNAPPPLTSHMLDASAIGLNGFGVDSLHDSSSIPYVDNDLPSSSTPTGPNTTIPSEPSECSLETKSGNEKRRRFSTCTSDEVVHRDIFTDQVIEYMTLQQNQFQTMQELNKTLFDAMKATNEYHTFHLVKKMKLEQLLGCIEAVQAIGDTEEKMISHAPHLMTDDVLDARVIRLKKLHELERKHTEIRQLKYYLGGNVR